MNKEYNLTLDSGELTVISVAMSMFCQHMANNSGKIPAETELKLMDWTTSLMQKVAEAQGVDISDFV